MGERDGRLPDDLGEVLDQTVGRLGDAAEEQDPGDPVGAVAELRVALAADRLEQLAALGVEPAVVLGAVELRALAAVLRDVQEHGAALAAVEVLAVRVFGWGSSDVG